MHGHVAADHRQLAMKVGLQREAALFGVALVGEQCDHQLELRSQLDQLLANPDHPAKKIGRLPVARVVRGLACGETAETAETAETGRRGDGETVRRGDGGKRSDGFQSPEL